MIDANMFVNMELVEKDVCIVGAGVAGITLAMELRELNYSVALFDSGAERQDDKIQQLYRAQSTPEHFPDTTMSRLRMLGGSSNHWENSTERFDPIDLEKRDWIKSSGWPISYEELKQYYPSAERYCGVGEDGYRLDYWLSKNGFVDLAKDSTEVETALLKEALPPTNFFRGYSSALESSRNIEIFYHANLVDIEYDSQNKKVKTANFKNSNLGEFSVSAKIFVLAMGGIENARMMLSFNEKYDDKLGNTNDLVGRYFMEHPVIRGAQFYPFEKTISDLYHGSVETNPGSESYRLVRARLKIKKELLKKHKTTNLRLFLSPQTKTMLSDGISSMHLLTDAIGDLDVPEDFDVHAINILKDLGVIANQVSKKIFDSTINEEYDQFAGYQMMAMIEQTPNWVNRIELGESKDWLGIKRVVVNWQLSDDDKERFWRSLAIITGDLSLNLNGRVKVLKERQPRLWEGQLGFSQHHMGTTKMGANDQKGVVDKNCRVYGSNNLFVAGSSTFPTGGHVPPTLTIAALAIRLSRFLQRELENG